MAELYAIVGSMPRALLMLKAKVPYLQLRFKDKPLAPHAAELAQWRARFLATRFIINDDLAQAEALGAWGVHLGQEDLRRYAPHTLRKTGLALGISTHSDQEIAQARSFAPALIGFGPIYPTTTKQVSHAPQGVTRLREVVAASPLPVVAIGGIDSSNLESLLDTGVPLVAMISQLERLERVEEVRSLMRRLKH